MISIDDAYYQLINNNVLDTNAFFDSDAGYAEGRLGAAFSAHKEQVLGQVRSELEDPNARTMAELPQELASYMVYIYNYLSSQDVDL